MPGAAGTVVDLSRVLQPATDRGVAMQVAFLLVLFGWAGWRSRTRPEWRLVVIGVALLTFGALGIRAAH